MSRFELHLPNSTRLSRVATYRSAFQSSTNHVLLSPEDFNVRNFNAQSTESRYDYMRNIGDIQNGIN